MSSASMFARVIHSAVSASIPNQRAMPGTPARELAEMEQLRKDSAQSQTSTTSGTDAYGSYRAITVVMPTDLVTTYNLLKESVKQSGGSEMNS